MRLPEFIKKATNNSPIVHRRDVVTFSIFLAVSTIFWGVRSAQEEHDATYEVALHIENMPAGAVFTTHIPATLRVTLYDNNIHLIDYGKGSSFRSLTVDFNRYADVAGNFRISGAELQSLLLNELSSTTQITAMSPALIDARYALTEGKKVPVRLLADVTTEGNYRDFAPEIRPDSVLVYAPRNILDTLRQVHARPLRAIGLTDTLRQMVGMELGVGVKATPDSVEVTVPVIQYVSREFKDIDIVAKDVPAGKRLILFPRQVNLRCLANYDHYSQFSKEDFELSVSYDSIKARPDRQFLPIDIYTPLNSTEVYNFQLSAQGVEYTIEE